MRVPAKETLLSYSPRRVCGELSELSILYDDAIKDAANVREEQVATQGRLDSALQREGELISSVESYKDGMKQDRATIQTVQGRLDQKDKLNADLQKNLEEATRNDSRDPRPGDSFRTPARRRASNGLERIHRLVATAQLCKPRAT